MNRILSPFFVCICCAFVLKAQQSSYILIEKIIVEGHKKTIEKTILRELDFKIGDSISTASMKERFTRNHEMLMNSGLFSKVEINIGKWDYEQKKVELIINVTESWYIFPFGWLSLADRNFNVWWGEKNHDLRRLNYQVGLNWSNLTGRRDRLKVSTEFGFGRKYEIDYQVPGINRHRTVGFFLNTLYSKNKEVWYKTQKDSLRFYRDESAPQIKRLRLQGGFSFRPKLRTIHSFQMAYFNNEVSESVATDKNPDFFLQGKTHQRYFNLIYKFTKDRRDNKFYPRKGSFFSISAEKDGLFSKKEDVQALYITSLYAKYFKIYKEKIDFETILKVRGELSGKPQPYYNTRALGYQNDYLRGYEYYVIDGANYAYWKNSFRINLYEKQIDLGEMVPAAARYFPIKAWLSINNDFGYVKNDNKNNDNILPNRLLWGRGVGLNMLLYRTTYFQLEISQNDLGKFGIYLHSKVPLE